MSGVVWLTMLPSVTELPSYLQYVWSSLANNATKLPSYRRGLKFSARKKLPSYPVTELPAWKKISEEKQTSYRVTELPSYLQYVWSGLANNAAKLPSY